MPVQDETLTTHLAAFDLLLQQLRDCHVQQVLHSRGKVVKMTSGPSPVNVLQLPSPVDMDMSVSEVHHEGTSTSNRLNVELATSSAANGISASERTGHSLFEPWSVKSSVRTPLPFATRLFAYIRGGGRDDGSERHIQVGRFQHALGKLAEMGSIRSGSMRPRHWGHCIMSGFKPCERVVTMPAMECLFGGLIILNTIVLALNIQVTGWDRGVDESFLMTTAQKYGDREPWQLMLHTTHILENVIGFAFVVEVLGKLCGFGIKGFVADPWNFLDVVVVTAWVLEVMTLTTSLGGAITLRALRVLRAFRVVRLLKTVEAFDSLFLLNAALRGCFAVLFWSLLYFVLVQIALALAVSQYLNDFYLSDTSIPHAEREEVYQYFGTFSYATLTMFEMTLANWPPVCRVMINRLSQWWVIFALLHKLTIGFAIVGIINGAVMQETFKAAARDQDVMVRDKHKQVEGIRHSLQLVFESAGRGRKKLDVWQFSRVCADPVLRLWLKSIGLNTEDGEKLFKLIDNGDGLLSVEEFLAGVERLRGFASSIDLHVSMRELTKSLKHNSKSQAEFLRTLDARVSQALGRHAQATARLELAPSPDLTPSPPHFHGIHGQQSKAAETQAAAPSAAATPPELQEVASATATVGSARTSLAAPPEELASAAAPPAPPQDAERTWRGRQVHTL